jgi:exosortase/archaeosortase family protein
MNLRTLAKAWWARTDVRFAVVFVSLAGVLSLVYAFPYASGGWVDRALTSYLAAYARAAGALVSVFDRDVSVSGQLILGRYPLQVVKDCDAIETKILFASAVIAFPAPWKKRLVGVAAGVLLLFVANLTRIATLYFVGVHAPKQFELVHREIWPLLLVAIALLGFFLWSSWTRGAAAPSVEQAQHATAR